jgi:hypothetical protein
VGSFVADTLPKLRVFLILALLVLLLLLLVTFSAAWYLAKAWKLTQCRVADRVYRMKRFQKDYEMKIAWARSQYGGKKAVDRAKAWVLSWFGLPRIPEIEGI